MSRWKGRDGTLKDARYFNIPFWHDGIILVDEFYWDRCCERLLLIRCIIAKEFNRGKGSRWLYFKASPMSANDSCSSWLLITICKEKIVFKDTVIFVQNPFMRGSQAVLWFQLKMVLQESKIIIRLSLYMHPRNWLTDFIHILSMNCNLFPVGVKLHTCIIFLYEGINKIFIFRHI